MILRTLYLKIGDTFNDGMLSVEYTYGFLKKSRCLCNYLEREVLKPLKFRCEGFNRIVIEVCTNPSYEFYINGSQVACAAIPFHKEIYESKQGDALTLYFAECLRTGLDQCSQFVSIPRDELITGIDRFVEGGMRNEWLYKSRTFREHQLKACLLCSLAPERFELTMQIWHTKKLVFDKVILRTDPDEIAFEHQFRNMEIVDGALIVTSRLGHVLWSAQLDSLGTN